MVPAAKALRRYLAVAFAALVVACDGTSSGGSGPEQDAAAARPVEMTVFAASSLTDAFTGMAELFEQRHPDARVKLNFLGSSELASQIVHGAPADVFASADEANVEVVEQAGLSAGRTRVFARNRLAIAVAHGNPKGISGLGDLQDEDLSVALCHADCPAGAYALEALQKANVQVSADSLEIEVRAVVNRVALGEADAGIVFSSDLSGDDPRVEGVEIPRADNVVAEYALVRLEGAPPQAQELVELVLSPAGQGILSDHGFLPR